ncbi:succinate--CoA ligase subunit alpha [Candidatus Bipolaricaulota bacterium]|nr:succinate--CoA ligase subunit alpha [Candidatus Bipolaricaulota bacterium]
MSILIDNSSNVVVQGITGGEGKFHTEQMKRYGTNVVAGVTPGKGGTEVLGLPVYNSIKEAASLHEIDVAVIFVPAKFAKDAILESVDNGIDLVVCITENIPVHDMSQVYRYVKNYTDSQLIGPNCPGVISPGSSKAGILPGDVFNEGNIGIVSRSGTLTYEISSELTDSGLGQSTVVGIGGDQIVGTNFVDVLKDFDRDSETELIVLVGEIGGTEEELAAEYIDENLSTPTLGYIAGFSAPKGKRMGHAGAIVSGEEGTAETKANVLEDHGVPVGRSPSELAELAAEALKS